MPSNLKFPPLVEIKRVISAAIRAGVTIGSIDIHPNKITIHPRDRDLVETPQAAYARWKASQQRNPPQGSLHATAS